MITVDQVKEACPRIQPERYDELTQALQEVRDQLGTRNRFLHFFAQTGHETQLFTKWEENLRYSAPRLMTVFPKYYKTLQLAQAEAFQPEKIANRVYGGRYGNVNPGDGFRYRGRGPMQLTFRNNYKEIGQIIGIDIESNPDLVMEFSVGFKTAIAFWEQAGCNRLADSGGDKAAIAAVTRAINGGYNGLKQREVLYNRAERIFKTA